MVGRRRYRTGSEVGVYRFRRDVYLDHITNFHVTLFFDLVFILLARPEWPLKFVRKRTTRGMLMFLTVCHAADIVSVHRKLTYT